MGVFWLEVRRSPLRWWFPFLVAVDLAVLFGRARWWIGVWPQASVAAQIPAFYFGPALAAVSAWTAGRTARHGLIDQLGASARPRWQAECVQLAVTLGYGILVYLVGAVVAAAVSSPSAGPGFLWPGYLLLGLSLLVICSAIGHLVGSWARSQILAPVLTGVGCLAAITLLGADSGFFALVGEPFMSVQAVPILLRILFSLAVASAAVMVSRSSVPGFRQKQKAMRTLQVLGTLVAVMVAGFAVAAAGPLTSPRTPPKAATCSDTQPRICLWPEDRKYTSQADAMARNLAALPAGLFVMPPVFYERGLRPGQQLQDFYINEGSMWEAAEGISINIVTATVPPGCQPATPAAAQKYFTAAFELATWLSVRMTGGGQPASVHGGPPGVDRAAVTAVATQPESVQTEWVRDRLSTVRNTDCG
ncbi:ABC transporter permease [Kitasatospora sp. NPDC059811]|uniref:DUF7224 domain-containing protein n=1 Tax=Streptomycetaceae TaxID=2062 RepID=UPI0007AEED87|nr:ABC transporter permease [Streptomyces sp. MJM8645]